ncbi:MAG: deoxyribonuclease IV [Gemmatimonadaceae bacterium]|nr:deoxyribonuclease IV [Gemmatimonadaceae bacterium]
MKQTVAKGKTAPKKAAVKKAAVKKAAVKKAAVKKAAMKQPRATHTGTRTSVPNPLVPKRRDAASDVLPPLPRVPAGLRIGTHVSSQGGSFAAPPRATEIGATALQLFTKTPNQWKEREIDAAEVSAFRAALAAAGDPVTVSHDSYLINLASPDDAMRARSLDSFATELRRCHALGIQYLVSHPGNFMDDRDAGIARNAAAITSALQAEPGPTILCLETTAGTGTALGATFEELAAIIAAIPAPLRARVGVCVDTCHIYSAGYDIVQDFDGVIATFDRVLGLDRLRVWHLNDSKTPFNSHRDRHELIGEGSLGELPFRRIMTDPRFDHTVRILETPKLDDATRTDRTMLNRLLSFLPAS